MTTNEARPRKRRSRWPVRIAILAVVVGFFALAPRLFKKKPIAVEGVKVERATVRDEVSSASAGEVVAEKHATVRAELSGRVVAVRHKRGERVKRGEPVVQLDPADLAAKLQQAQAALDAQRAQAAQAQAHADQAARALQRARTLADRGAAAPSALDDAQAIEREAQAAAQAAKGLAAQAEATLRSARVMRGKADLLAPFDGLLVDVPPEAGDELAPNAPAFEIVDDSKLHVEAAIDEADVGRIKLGQPATLRLDALPGASLAGVVSAIGPTVRRDEKGARTVRLDVAVSDLPRAAAAGLRAGMSANVDVRVAEKANVPSLPTNVIVGRGAKRTVYRVDGPVAHVVPIEIGLSSWERSEILSGLKVGDQVIATLNAKELADGVPVTVTAVH
jgi:HlyD family secretion protein